MCLSSAPLSSIFRRFRDSVDKRTRPGRVIKRLQMQYHGVFRDHQVSSGHTRTHLDDWDQHSDPYVPDPHHYQSVTNRDWDPYLSDDSGSVGQYFYGPAMDYPPYPTLCGPTSDPAPGSTLPRSHQEGEDEGDANGTVKQNAYAHLLFRCLLSAPDNTMTLREIYAWMEENCDRARDGRRSGWQNSVRHNLSMNKGFQRVAGPNAATSTTRKTTTWQLTEEAIRRGSILATTHYRKRTSRTRKSRAKQPLTGRQGPTSAPVTGCTTPAMAPAMISATALATAPASQSAIQPALQSAVQSAIQPAIRPAMTPAMTPAMAPAMAPATTPAQHAVPLVHYVSPTISACSDMTPPASVLSTPDGRQYRRLTPRRTIVYSRSCTPDGNPSLQHRAPAEYNPPSPLATYTTPGWSTWPGMEHCDADSIMSLAPRYF